MQETIDIWERAQRGCRWLVDRQLADGSWRGLEDQRIDAFYKGSWALTIGGHLAASQRLLDRIARRFLGEDGDLAPRGHPWHTNVHYLYPNAYVIIGAMVSGRYDVAMPAVSFLLGQQDPRCGGFYSRRTSAEAACRIDTMSTAAAGVACLASGHLQAARRAGECLTHLVERQPEPESRFYTTLTAEGALGVEFPDEEAWWRVVDTRVENQCWYTVGLPYAFLIRLAEATEERRFLDLARWFFRFQERCVDPWDGPSSGKAGWGSAMLYRINGGRRFRDVALHVADYISKRQNDDGSWTLVGAGYADDKGQGISNSDFDLTAEFSLWLALIAANVAARDEQP